MSTAIAVAAARTRVAATGWQSAVRTAAGLLAGAGAATPHYVDECVDVVRRDGPYIVVAPGVALAHARPESGGIAVGIAVAVLSAPVAFGHPSNDPVDVVFAFSSPDKHAHMALLARLADRLSHGLADRLRTATTDGDALAVLQEVTNDEP